MVEKKKLSEKEIDKKIVDLKIELLRMPTKRGSIKREIARMLTMKLTGKNNRTKLEDVKK